MPLPLFSGYTPPVLPADCPSYTYRLWLTNFGYHTQPAYATLEDAAKAGKNSGYEFRVDIFDEKDRPFCSIGSWTPFNGFRLWVAPEDLPCHKAASGGV